ncbi:hypothetical protein N431DRAFT_464850 [Stipitochalara longipes BDJ]|nr:hypothetical protein N431DRAFT_464850 [Stipitochalara longipes BDJ]
MSVQQQYTYIPQWTPINAPVNMPPKAATDAATKPTAKAKADKSAAAKPEDALNSESKLMWTVLCELAKDGKIVGVNWEDVKGPIEASTAHAARLRWDALKKRMSTRGFEMPASRTPAEGKAKVTKSKAPKAPKATTAVKKPRGKKAKDVEEADANEEGEGSVGEGEEESQEAQEGSGEEVAEDESA